jgi:hypothetical protein
MTTYEAVGAVSHTLKQLLSDRIALEVAENAGIVQPVPVIVGLPPEEPAAIAQPFVNLFLYRVCENAALQTQALPGRGERGAFGHPPLALDLHYLLTTYGTTNDPAGEQFQDEIVAHWLLGSAMRILHDFAIITPALETQDIGSPPGVQILDPVLVGAREAIKLSLQPVSLEDLSKVWTALSRPFRASAAYEVTVVQIDARVADTYSQPVGPGPISGPQVRAVSGRTPMITGIHAAGRADAFARAGDTLVLEGDGLLGDATQAEIAGIAGIGQVTSARNDRMTVVVPDDPRLQPGILQLSISHGVTFGEPPTRRDALRSNIVAFALAPRVKTAVLAGGAVTITGDRLYSSSAESVTLIQGQAIASKQYTTSTPTQLVMPVPTNLDPTAPARVFVRVNGVQSIDQVTL